MSVEDGSSFNWWERRMCFIIFMFLTKTGTMTLKSVPAARQPLYLQLNLSHSKTYLSLPLTFLLILLTLLQNVIVNLWWKRLSKLNSRVFITFCITDLFCKRPKVWWKEMARFMWSLHCFCFYVPFFGLQLELGLQLSSFRVSWKHMCIAFLLCINKMSLSVKVSLLDVFFKVSGAIYCMCLLINYIFG